MASPRYLLLQIRNNDDEMRQQEVECFCRILDCTPVQMTVHNLLDGAPPAPTLDLANIVLLGGSGDYSAAGEGKWLDRALDVLRQLHDISKPTFASCWGFQAMARAMGGRVIHDLNRAELGTLEISRTQAAIEDPIFRSMPGSFLAQMGHEDLVEELPPDAIHLAFSERVTHQAFRFVDRPIYCTQFHPELDLRGLLERVQAYPKYIEKISGKSHDEFGKGCHETPEANELLRQFVKHVLLEW